METYCYFDIKTTIESTATSGFTEEELARIRKRLADKMDEMLLRMTSFSTSGEDWTVQRLTSGPRYPGIINLDALVS